MLEDGLLDLMARRHCERVRFRRTDGPVKLLAATPEGGWAEALGLFMTEELLPLVRAFEQGGHERLDFVHREELGLRLIVAVHSTELGPPAGGLRRHELVTPEREVVRDALHLSRAMTLKHAASGIPRGGSKIVLHSPGVPEYGRDRFLGALAEEIDLSGTATGPDMGLPPSVFEALSARSRNVTCCGALTSAAAFGVHAAISAVAASLSQPLTELHVAVQGLGTLGQPLAHQLAREVAKLSVTDVDHRRIDQLLDSLNEDERARVQVVAPYQIVELGADVLSPAAMGGIITAARIPKLRCRAICGGANNILAAENLREELELARALNAAGILFVPDWIASAGGAIHAAVREKEGPEFDERHARARIQRTCGTELDRLLGEARRSAHAPFEMALRDLILPRGLREARQLALDLAR